MATYVTMKHSTIKQREGLAKRLKLEKNSSPVESLNFVMGLNLIGILLNTQQNLPRISLVILDRKRARLLMVFLDLDSNT
jgi:hypothetical protein